MATYNGTSGNDNYVGTTGNDTIYGNDGDDILQGNDGADTIYGGNGNDTLLDGTGGNPDLFADHLDGGAGNDTVEGGLLDSLDGGTGTDTLELRLDAAPGVISMDLSGLWVGNFYSIYGTTAQNFERVGWFVAGAYDDTIQLGTPTGQSGQLSGNGGNDVLTGGNGNDTLIAGLDGQLSSAETYTDVMHGGAGDDHLVGGIGDTFDGGSGNDRVSFDMSTNATGVNVVMGSIFGTTATIMGTTFSGIEQVDSVRGTIYDDTINTVGNTYNAFIEGLDGNDTLIGGFANDTIVGGTGADAMSGGQGNDVYYVDNAGDVVTETPGNGNDLVYSTIDYTLPDNVEQLVLQGTNPLRGTGNGLDNYILGNDAHDVLTGLAGNDTISGFGGIDSLVGGDGNDVLSGGTEDDKLFGNVGNDILVGDEGRDWMAGGAGQDTFRFDDGDFGGTTAATADEISDFSSAQHDLIDLFRVDAIVGGTDNAFTFIGTAAFTGVAGQLNYSFDGTYTLVAGDTNGDGVADFLIALDGNLTLAATDFVL